MKNLFLTILIGMGWTALARAMEWNLYKAKYNRSYDASEDRLRLEQYMKTLKRVEWHNKKFETGEVTYRQSVNQFSDRLPSELNRTVNCVSMPESVTINREEPNESFSPEWFVPPPTDVPNAVNWLKKGAVTTVKNQDYCGSCWAFGTVGVLEGQLFLKYNKLESLSAQNLIDCSWLYGNQGCNGGIPRLAYEYVKHNGGINSNKDYPYTSTEGKCRYNETLIEAKISGYVRIKSGDEEALKAAVATIGPISTDIHVSENFFTYERGVYEEKGCPKDLVHMNHAVLIVGYDAKPEHGQKPYWLVKNSWGKLWGERGYFRISMGSNECGIATDPSYPLLM